MQNETFGVTSLYTECIRKIVGPQLETWNGQSNADVAGSDPQFASNRLVTEVLG